MRLGASAVPRMDDGPCRPARARADKRRSDVSGPYLRPMTRGDAGAASGGPGRGPQRGGAAGGIPSRRSPSVAIPTASSDTVPHRRSRLRTAGLVVLIVMGLLAVGVAIRSLATRTEARDRQAGLQPFYDPPTPLPSTPGTLIRSERLGAPWTSIRAAAALRILYVTELPDGTPAASSGMVFIPSGPVPAGGRPVVAWAHPTVGFGVSCVPSRPGPRGSTPSKDGSRRCSTTGGWWWRPTTSRWGRPARPSTSSVRPRRAMS